MGIVCSVVLLCVLVTCLQGLADENGEWWDPRWRFRTTVSRPTPWRDRGPRPVEVAVDFPLLLAGAGVSGEFDPASIRVVERSTQGKAEPVPAAYRTESDVRQGREQGYVTWTATPRRGRAGTYDIYFETRDRGIEAPRDTQELLPPVNLLANPGFEDEANGLPVAWEVAPREVVTLGRFEHTTGERSLKVVIDEDTAVDIDRKVTLSQSVDVRKFAGREMVFECDLLAERAAYGLPLCIELQQFRADGSRILECAVQPRWLTLELAEGQFVQFSQRGRFSPEAATVKVVTRLRCLVEDADTGERISGPESFFTLWVDRMVLRPGERWPWPPASNAGFVEGALADAPLNRGFEFTGRRRLAFNGASEGTLTCNRYNPDPRSVHWGLEAGTLEFWCRPLWDGDDGADHVFFEATAYGHRLQSRLRKLGADGGNKLEFSIADADGELRTVRGPASFKAGAWHHVAATWDFSAAHLQLFLDGEPVNVVGPGDAPWASSLRALEETREKGIGITEEDRRSLPMQAFIGGDRTCTDRRSAQAVLDEFRISDVARYVGPFTPARSEFEVDGHTRALFHFDNERHGVHDSDDRFVYGHLACELHPQQESAVLNVFDGGTVERREVVVKPHAVDELFQANRAENRLAVTRPFRELPDPRFVEYIEREVERTVSGADEGFTLHVGGDFEPLMRSVTFELAETPAGEGTVLPRWRANDNVVPFSVDTLAATLAPGAKDDAERAFEVFKYATEVTNYYDANYCETFPSRHRRRVSYTLSKALNIYPFDQCGPLNYMLRKLFLTAGVSSNDSLGTHHQFEQAFYQGDFRLFDLSPRIYWLERDNRTVLSRRGFEDDLYLKLRQGSGVQSALRGRKQGPRLGTATRPHSMDFVLRPGERASVCWHNEGRWFELTGQRQPLPLAKVPPYYGNGAVVYEPVGGEGGAAEFDNLVVGVTDDGLPVLQARDPAQPASLIYHARCPYIFSYARISGSWEAPQDRAIRLSVSFDRGANWQDLWQSTGARGEIRAEMKDEVAGRYEYRLKLELSPGPSNRVTGLRVRTTLVDSPLALPGRLSKGENRIAFVGGPPAVPVKTVCRWVERHRSDLGVALNALSYYMNGDETHRNLFIIPPGEEAPVSVRLEGRRFRGNVFLEGLPRGWLSGAGCRAVEIAGAGSSAEANFALRAQGVARGDIRAFDVVLREGEAERRIPAQVLVAESPLVREAEGADQITGQVSPVALPEASGGQVLVFHGAGQTSFDLTAPQAGTYALWLRARWDNGSSTAMTLAVDDGQARELKAGAMTGFIDWTDHDRALTKMFAFFGEQFAHWSWYRIPGVELGTGKHRLTLRASAGTSFDALVLLPQNPVMDRAAMNLFQNWNYAPWQNPL